MSPLLNLCEEHRVSGKFHDSQHKKSVTNLKSSRSLQKLDDGKENEELKMVSPAKNPKRIMFKDKKQIKFESISKTSKNHKSEILLKRLSSSAAQRIKDETKLYSRFAQSQMINTVQLSDTVSLVGKCLDPDVISYRSPEKKFFHSNRDSRKSSRAFTANSSNIDFKRNAKSSYLQSRLNKPITNLNLW